MFQFIKRNKSYLFFVLLYPTIFLLFQYSQNYIENNLSLFSILIVGMTLSLSSLVLALILYKLGNLIGAILGVFVFWLCFWFFESMYQMGIDAFMSRRVFFITLIIMVFVLTFLVKMLVKKIPKSESFSRVLSFYMALISVTLFLFNFPFSSVFSATQANANQHFKTEWYIDETLPQPNIFWIQMDGMPGLESINQLFDVNTSLLEHDLLERGFVINADVKVNAIGTQTSLPSLFSPQFYDDFWQAYFQENYVASDWTVQEDLIASFRNQYPDFNFQQNVANHLELFNVLVERGYHLTAVIQDASSWIPWLTGFDAIYFNYTELPYFNTEADSLGLFQENRELLNLLLLTTPLSIFTYRIENAMAPVESGEFLAIEYDEEVLDAIFENYNLRLHHRNRVFFRNFIHAMDHLQSPSFVYIADLNLHSWIVYNNLEEWEEFQDTYGDFFDTAHFALLSMIDLIKHHDPNAVIVIQSDHGVHHPAPREHLYNSGFSVETLSQLRRSTMSAVRIPDEYGGLAEPLHPLNITRELVNRFVGENYQLLPQ